MRKRERDEVAVAARRRLDALAAELSDLRPDPAATRPVSPDPPAARPVPAPPLRVRSDRPPGPQELLGAPGRPPPRPESSPGPGWATRSPTPRPVEPRIPQPRGPYDPSVPPQWPEPDEPDEPDDQDELLGGESFLERAVPVLAGPPGALLGHEALVHRPVGRALPPDPARVPPPGRHAVEHPGASVGQWFEERLPGVVRGRLALSGQHLAVLTAMLGVALALAGWLALRSGSAQEPVPQARFVSQQADSTPSGTPSSSPASGAASATAGGSGTATGGAAGSPGDVVVDVVGKVRRPGIVTLPTGSRVNDAVQRAGGVRAGVHTEALNLARVLVDGEQIVVGQAAQTSAIAAPGSGAASGAGAAPSAAAGALVNLNTAGLSELDTLPGVGPVTAQKILDWRTAHGAFSAVDELLEVDGIGDKTLADIAPRATL